MFLANYLKVGLLVGTCAFVVACDDDDSRYHPGYGYAPSQGGNEYSGTIGKPGTWKKNSSQGGNQHSGTIGGGNGQNSSGGNQYSGTIGS